MTKEEFTCTDCFGKISLSKNRKQEVSILFPSACKAECSLAKFILKGQASGNDSPSRANPAGKSS